jgi:hypothetical protein
MKNVLLPLVFMLAIVSVQAQKRGDRQENRREIAANTAPEERASLQAKKMTLALDLTDKQQEEIADLLAANHAKREENKMTPEVFKALSKDEKVAVYEKKLDEKIATKRAIKEILNQEQYARFEKMAARKKGSRALRMQKPRRG